MEKEILIIIFSVVLISVAPQVHAQEDLGQLIEQQQIIFEIGKHSDIHVKHVIDTGRWAPDSPRIIEILSGGHSNLTVADEDGDKLSFSYDKETFEKSKYIILNQKQGGIDLVVEYDLDNFLEMEDGIWKMDVNYTFDLMVIVEEDIELIFVNSRPVDVSNAKGINCIGCGLTLEYFDDEKSFTKEISFSEGKFEIEFLSNRDISEIEFIEGGTNLLNFDVKDINQLHVLKIPLEKFLNPFEVYFTEKDDTNLDQLDKIRKTEFSQDETHVNLSFRTFSEGTVSIVGATPEEHQTKLEQIDDVKSREVESEKIDDEKTGVPLPIPGSKAASELAAQMVLEEKTEFSFSDELKQGQTQNSENYITIVGIIAGIISAAVIVGVVLKLKKK